MVKNIILAEKSKVVDLFSKSQMLALLFFTVKTMLGLLVYVSFASLAYIVVFFRSFTIIFFSA